MYCIQCGVRLADTEKSCPLCHTQVCHPEFSQPRQKPLYPEDRLPKRKHSKGGAVFFTAVAVLAAFTVAVCDLQMHRDICWSAYVMGALVVFYTGVVLPMWFRRPNPVIFVPCSFGAGIGYLLMVALMTGGKWFLPFGLPVAGCVGLLVTAVVTLLRCLPRGKLYILGGGIMAFGGFMILLEFLMSRAFEMVFLGWSVYPLAALALLGGYLIFLGICPPAREAMERKFFF